MHPACEKFAAGRLGTLFFDIYLNCPLYREKCVFFVRLTLSATSGERGGASAEDSVDTDLWRSQLVLVESAARRNGPCKTVAWNV